MSCAFISLLFCCPQLVGALIIAGFLLFCAKVNPKARKRRETGDSTTYDQKTVLQDEPKLDENNKSLNHENPYIEPEPKSLPMGMFYSPKEKSLMKKKKKHSNDEPKDDKVEKSHKKVSEDRNGSSSSCDTCDSKIENNANNRSKSNKKSTENSKKDVETKSKERDEPEQIKKQTMDEGVFVIPRKLRFAKEGGSDAVIFMDNRTTKRLGFKVHTTDGENFGYDPVYSFLEPDSNNILIVVNEVPTSQDALMCINFIEVPAGLKDAKAFFKGLDSFDNRFKKVRIPLNIL